MSKEKKIKLIKTTVLECMACNQHHGTYPNLFSSDSGDACKWCGNTSFRQKEGRPWGEKHRHFRFWVKEYMETKNSIPKEWFDKAVVC